MAQPTTKWLQIERRMGLDGNPLRRRSDVVAAWLTPATAVLIVALVPLVALVISTLVRHENASVARASHSWTYVQGRLLRSAPGPAQTDHGHNLWNEVAPARWTFHGRHYTGGVPVPAGSRKGSLQTVRLNAAGDVEMPPLAPSQLTDRIDTLTFIVTIALGMFLLALKGIVRRVLDKRRLTAWEADWLTVGPRWSHQG